MNMISIVQETLRYRFNECTNERRLLLIRIQKRTVVSVTNLIALFYETHIDEEDDTLHFPVPDRAADVPWTRPEKRFLQLGHLSRDEYSLAGCSHLVDTKTLNASKQHYHKKSTDTGFAVNPRQTEKT
jgi:hypothetical protein